MKKSRKKFRSRFTKKNIFITIFLILFVLQFIQVQALFKNLYFLQGRDTSLIKEVGQVKNAYLNFGNDLNEIRKFLRLPLSNYQSLDELAKDEDKEKNTDDVQLALFKYLDSLSAEKSEQIDLSNKLKILRDMSNDAEIEGVLIQKNLTLTDLWDVEDLAVIKIKNDQDELIIYYLDKNEGTLYFKTKLEKSEIEPKDYDDLKKDLIKFLKTNTEKLIEQTAAIKKIQENIEKTINTQQRERMKIYPIPTEKDLKITYAIYNKNDELIGEISINTAKKEITLVDHNETDSVVMVTDISTALGPFLDKLDARNFIEKKSQDAIKSFEETLVDKGFQLLLEKSGFYFGEKKEDNARIYYKLYDENGNLINTFQIEKVTGTINILDKEGAIMENLLFFDASPKKKLLTIPDFIPSYSDELLSSEKVLNILVAGKNGMMVDTLIFVHIDEVARDIRMISIPRDLYYDGRKINAYYSFYGMDELTRIISEISGYKLDKYILIDMYAFIDVVDATGGIDVHLDDALIDPTYKTVDNGVEGTLHYEPGDYHLGGKESLRIARSRHSSSDFARAERQQLILESLQEKARNFGFGDADVIYELIKIVLSKTETNINLDEAIAYFFRYQGYEIKSQGVLSSRNVLMVPPYVKKEECAAGVEGEAVEICAQEHFAYTLVPEDENWDVVKWFFRERFE
jgi:polyisoprenyl-teichoic acid--peptidoglycan teichoic acid transferase